MKPYYKHAGISIFHGDCREVLRQFMAESVQTCVTSPPYFGLRDYGITPTIWGGDPDCKHRWKSAGKYRAKPDRSNAGHGANGNGVFSDSIPRGTQSAKNARGSALHFGDICGTCGAWCGSFGLEPSPAMFVEHAVEIFREVRRVLKKDGTLWLNLGDSYANDGKWGGSTSGKHVDALHGDGVGRGRRSTGLKPKDMVGIPWRVAFALQDDGWFLRQDIIWSKPNPMPESVTDRCTKSHEYLFLLSKSERYYFDSAAIREPVTQSTLIRVSQNVQQQIGSDRAHGGDGAKSNGNMKAVTRKRVPSGWDTSEGSHRELQGRYPANGDDPTSGSKDLAREEQGLKTSARFGHGAGWRAKKSGNKERKFGVDRDRPDSHLGASVPWEGVDRNRRSVWTIATQPFAGAHFATYPIDLVKPCILAGSRVGDLVLDPFGGACTTMLVAKELGRQGVACELKEEYIKLSINRLRQDVLVFEEARD